VYEGKMYDVIYDDIRTKTTLKWVRCLSKYVDRILEIVMGWRSCGIWCIS